MQDYIFKIIALLCTCFAIVILGLLLWNVFSTGFGRLDIDFLMNSASRKPERAGIYSAWMGTIWILVITILIAFPLGVGAGVYLEEYSKKSKLKDFIEVNIANLAAVPSIIYGLLGLELFVRALSFGATILSGSLTLALLVLPLIIVSTRESLKSVPYSLREASYGLGATKWQTIWHQVLPASLSGIFTGVILAISRAIGETAPLIVVGALMFKLHPPSGPLDKFTVLPMQIFNWISAPQKEFTVNAAAAIIVLLTITFVMNGIAVYLRYRAQKKVKW